MRRRAIPLFVCLFLALFVAGTAYGWQPPVPDPVVDNWRPPEHRYAAGNRGVDFAPSIGAPVNSAGPGTVTFAGPVGGILYVTVSHEGGIRTTYGGLAEISVSEGQALDSGAVVGKSGAQLHFGVRANGEYVDPNSLFGKAHLVPTQ